MAKKKKPVKVDMPGSAVMRHKRLLTEYQQLREKLARVRAEMRIRKSYYDSVIPAEVHSDDHRHEAIFDALPWFEQASDDEIRGLAECDFGCDYAADVVAEFVEDLDPDVADVFEFKDAEEGFECNVNRPAAMNWLKENRPELHKELE